MRQFVCGDIHGCYDELMNKLSEINFDFDSDILYSVGDLVDRGPYSLKVLRLINEKWFKAVKGNHEDMILKTIVNPDDFTYPLILNGGEWITTLNTAEEKEVVKLIISLPVTRTVKTEKYIYGLVHAAPHRVLHWGTFCERAAVLDNITKHALWDRSIIRDSDYVPNIEGVDLVYCGHTPLREPLQKGNVRWIDTGCFATGIITVEELI